LTNTLFGTVRLRTQYLRWTRNRKNEPRHGNRGYPRPRMERGNQEDSRVRAKRKTTEHFTIFQDPRDPRQRSQARYLYCDTEFRNEKKYRPQHLIKCTRLPESVARPLVIPVVLPSTLSKHFAPFVHPNSKAPQAKCLYCKRVLASLHSINLKNHLTRCLDAPEEANHGHRNSLWRFVIILYSSTTRHLSFNECDAFIAVKKCHFK
jgi:hypothetical protein